MSQTIIAPKRWNTKPPMGVQIQWGHPLANGLIACFLFNEGGGQPRNLRTKQALTLNGSPGPTYAVAPVYGMGFKTVSANSNAANLGSAMIGAGGNFSTVIFANLSSSLVPANNPGVITRNTSATPQIFITTPASLPVFRVNSQGTAGIGSSGTFSLATPIMGVFTWNNGTGDWQWFLNGLLSTNGNVATSMGAGSDYVIGADTPGGSGGFDGIFHEVLEYSRILTAAEVLQLYVDPYCFLQPQSPMQRYWLKGSASAARPHELTLVGVG